MNTPDMLETELKQALSGPPLAEADVDRLSQMVVRTFEERQRKVKHVMYAYLAGLMVFLLFLFYLYFNTTDLRACLLLAVAMLIVFEGTVLMKLWFWVLHSKLSTLREIKRLQVQLAELSARLNRKGQ